ncbi:MAG: hypothetical protein ACR2QW_12960, partial [bacterium]
MIIGNATRLFILCEIVCFFFYSIWWRKTVPLPLSLAVGFVHLWGLIVILRLWEGARRSADFSKESYVEPSPSLSPVIWLILGAGALIQSDYLFQPVLSGPDEPVVLLDHLGQVALF